MANFVSIRESVENIRDSLDNLDCPATEEECNNISCELNSIEHELDNFEPDEPDEFIELIPSGMSVGDADSLKELIINWRKERGYGSPS